VGPEDATLLKLKFVIRHDPEPVRMLSSSTCSLIVIHPFPSLSVFYELIVKRTRSFNDILTVVIGTRT
jgi:hypothetical protein